MLLNSYASTPFTSRKEKAKMMAYESKAYAHQPSVPKVTLNSIDENVMNPIEPKMEPPTTTRKKNPRFSYSIRSSRSSQFTSPVISNAPITPQEARKNYSSLLNKYELREIDEYPEIYFLGIQHKKVQPTMSISSNYGYDDSNSHYRAVVGDHIAYRFEIRAILGKGAFGQVVRCYDHKTKTNVALKIIVNTEIMQEQGRVEIGIVQHLNKFDKDHKQHIIRGIDFFIFRKHICASFEILGPNLYEYSRSLRFKPISSNAMKPISQQILSALAFCHSHGVVHCDMKPENILLLPGGFKNIKIIDFGSSCFIGHQRYEYIQSRFYRAPEVILGIKYGPPMDIWSFGCIVVEMMIGRPIFPGNDEHEQIEMLMECFGPPPKEVMMECSRRNEFFFVDGRLRLPKDKRKRRQVGSTTLQQMTHINDTLLIDLLMKCFEWDQNKRITAEEALNHPYFTSKEVQISRTPSNMLPELIR